MKLLSFLTNPVQTVVRPVVFGTVAANHKTFLHRSYLVGLLLLIGMVLAFPAFAADPDFLEPINEAAKSSTTAIVAIAGALFGFVIVLIGVIMVAKGRIDGDKLWNFFFGALIVTVGPAAISWLIEQFQK